MALRSFLYVPADRADRFARATQRGADALIIDLEDAVPVDRKRLAREQTRHWLLGLTDHPPIWVRLNSGEQQRNDLDALADVTTIRGFCLAKTASRDEVEQVADRLQAAGSSAALAPILESARAVMDAREIAAAPRVRHLQLGEADLRAELGIEPGPDELELLALRSQVVLASAAAGVRAPLGPASMNFTDLAAFRRSGETLRRLGFVGRTCIHPTQIAVVNEVFTPSPQQLTAARSLLDRMDAAGGAATTDADGSMIDEALARRARALLSTVDD